MHLTEEPVGSISHMKDAACLAGQERCLNTWRHTMQYLDRMGALISLFAQDMRAVTCCHAPSLKG